MQRTVIRILMTGLLSLPALAASHHEVVGIQFVTSLESFNKAIW